MTSRTAKTITITLSYQKRPAVSRIRSRHSAKIIWSGVFYSLARPVVRGYFEKAIWLLSGVFIANYMFFGKDLGLLTPDLIYENGLQFGRSEQLLNIGILFIVIVLFYILYKYRSRLTSDILTVGVIALLCMSVVNMKTIQTGVSGLTDRDLNR